MKPLPVLLLFFINCFVAAKKSSKPEKVEMRLINGDEGEYGQFPYTVLLGGYRPLGVIRYCGGALLSDQWIVTCAKCLDQVIRFDIHLGAKEFRQVTEPGRELYESKSFFAHPKYQRGAYDYDIGLVQLPTKVSLSRYIRPVQLPPVVDFTGQIAIATGWGASTLNDLSLSRTLHFAEFQVLTRDECNYRGNLPSSIFCARATRNQNICSGDGGGPLVLPDRNVLIGIISFTTSCEKGVGGFVKVSSFLDWIHSQTGIQIPNNGNAMFGEASSYAQNMNDSRHSVFYESHQQQQQQQQQRQSPTVQGSPGWNLIHNPYPQKVACGGNKLCCALHQTRNSNVNSAQDSKSLTGNGALGIEQSNIHIQSNQMNKPEISMRPPVSFVDSSAGRSSSYVQGSFGSSALQNGRVTDQNQLTNDADSVRQSNSYAQGSLQSGIHEQQTQFGIQLNNQGRDSHPYRFSHHGCSANDCSGQTPGYHQTGNSIKKNSQVSQAGIFAHSSGTTQPRFEDPAKKISKAVYSSMHGANQQHEISQYITPSNQAQNAVNPIGKSAYGSHQPQKPQIQMPEFSVPLMQMPQRPPSQPKMPHIRLPNPPRNIYLQTHETFEKFSKQKISSIAASQPLPANLLVS